MSNIKDLSFTILETADGSPTLLLPESQPMHSLEGAFSETLEIYAPVAEKGLELPSPHFLSLGLGLGYNEIMTAAMALKAGKKDWALHSFEALPELTEAFKGWLEEGQNSALSPCYENILQRFSQSFSVNSEEVKRELLRIQFHGAIGPENKTGLAYQGIFYDAFSSDTDPHLWTAEHLESFLKSFCAKECYLSTYASTGDLKRSLKSNNFKVQTKKGFGKKRESIFAERHPESQA